MDSPKETVAAILVEQKKDLIITKCSLPRNLEYGQVLVKLSFSGICGSQIGEIDGVKGPDKFLPHMLGHEGVGEVLKIGPGVSRFKPEDQVIAHWKPASRGIAAIPPKYEWNGTFVNAGFVTTFNQFSIISENRLTKKPAYIKKEVASLYGCAVTTGFGLVENKLSKVFGKTAIVFGAGGVGLNIIQALSLAGIAKIYAVDLFDNRLKLAKKCGATNILNANSTNPWTTLKKEFTEKKPDVFIDNTGNTEVISKGFEMIDKSGDLLLVGVPNYKNTIKIPSLPLHFGKTISGTHGGEVTPDIDIPRYSDLIKMRNFCLDEIVTEIIELHDINRAISKIKNGEVSGRTLIKY